MSFNLRNRSLLTVQDYTQREFRYLLDLARDLKGAKYAVPATSSLGAPTTEESSTVPVGVPSDFQSPLTVPVLAEKSTAAPLARSEVGFEPLCSGSALMSRT